VFPAFLTLWAITPALSGAGADTYRKSVQPVLARACYGCHNAKLKTADLDLESLRSAADVPGHSDIWEKVADRLRNGTMPPKGIPRPSPADVETVSNWIGSELARAAQNAKPDPGRVTARRLNRAEYNNTIRDLLGVDFHPADDFPQDDSGYGFDNIGDVLSLSPVLVEKYLKAAETAVTTALNGPEKLKPTVLRHQPPDRVFTLLRKALTEYDETGLSLPNALHATLRFPADGEYVIRVALEGRRPNGAEPVHVGFWIDGKQVNTLELTGNFDGGSLDLFGAQGEFRQRVTAGDHWIAASLIRLYEGLPPSYGGPNRSKKPEPPPPDPSRFMRVPPGATPEQIAALKKTAEERIALIRVPANRVWVHFVEAMGPYDQPLGPERTSLEKVLACGHLDGRHEPGCDRKIVAAFARRAFRRPVEDAELAPYLKLAADARGRGASFDEAIAPALEAVLVSPDFLFRIESEDSAAKTAAVRPIGQYALASRLSYFLWSSTPDDELMRAADEGTLRKPDVLAAQVLRMLKDSRSHSLVENFAGQWLELRRLESIAPDREKFPEFDEYLRMSMRQETEMFFESLVREDRSVLDLLDAKDTFLNEKLAAFYGIPGVKGAEFRRVQLPDNVRGGVLTQASVLTVSSYATRTSPVLRGKWILENLLNSPIPPPPPNVPALDESKIGAAGSMRTQMDAHRANPACASCHSKMDPLGFAFENFDAIGHWRTQDGKFPIDASGTLPDGRTFKGPGELKSLLLNDHAAFTECITEKLLTYALGRGLERYDQPVVKEIAARTAAHDYRFSALVMEIVNSLPFQNRRGERTP
jgi:mono/diheme cytochrome c family protein